jgi:hypothetical protein
MAKAPAARECPTLAELEEGIEGPDEEAGAGGEVGAFAATQSAGWPLPTLDASVRSPVRSGSGR